MALVVLSTLLKLAFVFYGTAFQSYLGSDMGGYWTRAMQRFNGDLFSINQWVIWPPLFHIILAYIFKASYLLGLFDLRLGVVLGLNVLFSSASVFYLYRISERVTRSHWIALATAVLYAFTYHCFYFNAFVLSENFAVPLVVAALYYLLQNRLGYCLLSGVLLAVATGIRPGYGLIALSFGCYALWPESKLARAQWLKHVGVKGLPKAALFSLGFIVVIVLVLFQNHYISNGRVKGLAASSGLNYFFSFTKTYEVRSRFDGYYYVIIPPGTVRHPENGKLLTVKPIYDSAFFEQLADEHIRQHPKVLLFKLSDLWELYFGTLFPSYPSAYGFHPWIEIFKYLFFFMTLVVAFSFTTSLWRQGNIEERWLILSIIILSLVTSYLFNSEHRYIYGFLFAIHLLAVEAIAVIAREFRRHLKKMILCVAALALILGANAGYSAMRKQGMPSIIHMRVHDYDKPFEPRELHVDTLNFPFEKT
ncbi:MAG: glycosyltransferase family 39 protein, partial [Desulfatitalea sp.]|nr:glycosyltransferase family 39 protein [Desulfatitalea sp.]